MRNVVAVLAAALCCGSALAATGNPWSHNPAAGALLLGLAIAYLLRRRKIGGWLLYYYMQLYIAVPLDFVISLPALAKQIKPSEWDNANL